MVDPRMRVEPANGFQRQLSDDTCEFLPTYIQNRLLMYKLMCCCVVSRLCSLKIGGKQQKSNVVWIRRGAHLLVWFSWYEGGLSGDDSKCSSVSIYPLPLVVHTCSIVTTSRPLCSDPVTNCVLALQRITCSTESNHVTSNVCNVMKSFINLYFIYSMSLSIIIYRYIRICVCVCVCDSLFVYLSLSHSICLLVCSDVNPCPCP